MHCVKGNLMAKPNFKGSGARGVGESTIQPCAWKEESQAIWGTVLVATIELLLTHSESQTLSQEPLQENCSLTWL